MPMSRKNASARLDIVVTTFSYSQPESRLGLFTESQDTPGFTYPSKLQTTPISNQDNITW